MVKLNVRLLYTKDKKPFKERTAADICRRAVDEFDAYGLSFLDGIEIRKEKADKLCISNSGNNICSDIFDDHVFRKRGDSNLPHMFFTPTDTALSSGRPMGLLYITCDITGYGNDMLAMLNSTHIKGFFKGHKNYALALHELGHSLYGLKHHEQHASCAMGDVSVYRHLCEDCQTKARKVDEELRGK